ncbi:MULTISPECIES: autotransporter outer membrane beta-barrel domain-containing protein [Caldilinea]|uniref:hypothetical protein n=1 Tax=Caldilinea TaxID=233191 RepID=UPI0003108F9D|nr:MULTISPECIES: hypothetical protein [Caldilinea]GIV72019.1 MAG: hypothetical protein KatS3mg049_0575 [Caldilinea sp.]
MRNRFFLQQVGRLAGAITIAVGALLFVLTAPQSSSGAPGRAPAVESAAITPLISYQGRLLNPTSGVPQNGTFTFVFRLYNVAEGGAALWTETKDIAVSNGLFSTLLGDVTALPTSIFDGQNLWLGVKVGTDAEATPRQRIAAVAYALYSDNADRLDGQDSTAFAAAGHIHDDRYYTEAESDARFVNATGDAMSGSAATPVLSVTQTGAGVSGYFTSTASYGVVGETASSAVGIAGVRGTAGQPGTTINGKYGVLGQSDTGRGVTGVSRDSNGLYGWSTSTWAVRGEGEWGGVYALSFGAGSDAIRGENTATSGASWGVVGTSASPTGRGVAGFNSATTGTAEGIYGSSSSTSGRGVSGYAGATTGATYGVYGQNASTNGGAGVRGDSPYVGVWGSATSTTGTNWGVYGSTVSASGYGGYFSAPSGGVAGRFVGNVQIAGTLSKSSGSFKIDHPLDPMNKYLYHSFVESPDMMNVYNGNVTLDESGAAWVELPAYFEALNRDVRYQLTPIGGPGPNLYIAQEVQGNRFRIAGGAPGLRVSWQVTGIRQDAYAQANPIVVEVDKPVEERGTLLHPEAHGLDHSYSLDARLHNTPFNQASMQDVGVAAAEAQKAANAAAQAVPQAIRR